MKITFFIFICLFSLASCTKEEPRIIPVNVLYSVGGTWEVTQTGTIMGDVETLTDYVHETGCTKDNYVFTNNRTLEINTYDSSSIPCELNTINGEYGVGNNVINVLINATSETFDWTVILINNTTLKFKDINNNVTVLTKV
jgi:hypothetical protein